MEKLDWRYINEISNLVKISNRMGSHRGCVRLNINNSLEHEQMKSKICYWLKKNCHPYITEAIFKDHPGVADILILDTGVALEVLHTETDEEFKKKLDKYPEEITVNKIRTDEEFSEDMIY